MTKQTHIAVGLASATGMSCFLRPMRVDDPIEYIGAIGIAVFASILPDIDYNKQSQLKKSFKTVFIYALLALVVLACYWAKFGQVPQLLKGIIKTRQLIGMVTFLIVCIIGYYSPHRTFTHWLVGAIAFSVPVYFIVELPMTLWFSIGFLSHQLIDMLNKQKITWLYPLNYNFAVYWCKADSPTSSLIGMVATVLTPVFAILSSR